MIWALVDPTGVVVRARVRKSSGQAELDHAAIEIARLMRFSPALNGDDRISVWIMLPIVFATR